ncbi:MAG TPA: hypothetical protein VN578_20065 [Candidatus Binatia bacterium]|jgi:hypothetical protein|nr:hypothetical protein [Candidatus Binatia bacterium]
MRSPTDSADSFPALAGCRQRIMPLLLLALGLTTTIQMAVAAPDLTAIPVRGSLALNQPVAVYNNWSAYDELSDNIELTESLAMKEVDQILRLRRSGVRIDYYVMDAFWYSTNGGYREFRRPHWPNGPDRWLKACLEHQIKPGLWVASNVPFRLEVLPEWRSSMDATGSAMCFFDGGFLAQFIDTLQFWYDRGVRLFKFDFANLTIATPAAAKSFTKDEIIRQNGEALRAALQHFKQKNPEVLFAAFNGFGGDTEGTAAPIRQTVDLRWLEAFDSLYCGDPRFSDVPAMNSWRSMDLYSDHMVRYYEANGVPLERIDNTGCMFGVAGTCYQRRTAAWKSMLLLEHARGGWMNVYYGNLELLDDAKAEWFAKVQKIYFLLQSFGRTFPFGGLPGKEEPGGFCSIDASGALYTVVNPSQAVRVVRLPQLHRLQPPLASGRLQFRDAGFQPRLSRDELTLGPEQLAVVGYGEYAKSKYDLGIQEDVIIPKEIRPLSAQCAPDGTNAVLATLNAPATGDLRIVLRQFAGGKPRRSSAGAPPNGTTLAKLLKIEVSQNHHSRPVVCQYDKAIWSGLSWGVGEVPHHELDAGLPITIRCTSSEKQPVELRLEFYAVKYD